MLSIAVMPFSWRNRVATVRALGVQ